MNPWNKLRGYSAWTNSEQTDYLATNDWLYIEWSTQHLHHVQNMKFYDIKKNPTDGLYDINIWIIKNPTDEIHSQLTLHKKALDSPQKVTDLISMKSGFPNLWSPPKSQKKTT